jgi:aarF domain-containing kinase
MQPVLQLLLAPEADELQQLVEREVVRVTEAMSVGTAIQGISSIPPAVRALLPPVNASTKDQAAMLMLREQVLQVWGLLQSSRGFDPAMLQPLVQVLLQPQARAMGGRVAESVTRRLAARTLQQLLRPPSFPATAKL